MSEPPLTMRQVLRWSRRLVAVVVSVCALAAAVRLVALTTAGTTGELAGVQRQLAFLRSALDGGAGDEAQRLFPEGYFFLHVLYGLSWVELGMRLPAASGRSRCDKHGGRWDGWNRHPAAPRSAPISPRRMVSSTAAGATGCVAGC
ncbi:hypothetical protein ACFQX6_19945 [Streptosporangium lutulentum]